VYYVADESVVNSLMGMIKDTKEYKAFAKT
jgi:hypothetical protein